VIKSAIEAVLFDCDDTLFDRKTAQRTILGQIVREFPVLFAGIGEDTAVDAFYESDRIALQEQELYKRETGEAARISRARRFLSLLELDETFSEKITASYITSYPDMESPVPGANHIVEALSKSYRLGIVSNGLPDAQVRKLDALGIRHLFGCILISEEIGIRKPNPEIFWQAAAVLNVEPKSCLHVADSFESDVVGAKRAGMLVCWFNPEGMAPPEPSVQPDFELDFLARLFEFL
jgi:putative hydrolase of the HAD superfamily